MRCEGCMTPRQRYNRRYLREYMRKHPEIASEYQQRPEAKERRREYEQRPEVKERRREYFREYKRRPEVKERRRMLDKARYHHKKAEREEGEP